MNEVTRIIDLKTGQVTKIGEFAPSPEQEDKILQFLLDVIKIKSIKPL
ncbi:MAG: hypothetical protein N3I35_19700 [Clostridia bacterium]|nr:hypothetical protein [Clostridia bacterium]